MMRWHGVLGVLQLAQPHKYSMGACMVLSRLIPLQAVLVCEHHDVLACFVATSSELQ
jgi:hypothetical protein